MPNSYTTQKGIHWIEEGPGANAQVAVLIHGLGGDALFWGAEQKALARRFRVLAVDLRGSGLSPDTTERFSIQDLADDVVSVLNEAKISSAHIVGFSMGGLVAQAIALADPNRVKSLVLAATFATTNKQARLFLEAVASVYRDGASTKQLFDLILPWLFSMQFLADPRSAPYTTYPEDETVEQSREDWLRLLDAQLAFDARAQLSRIEAPTLVICGDEDRLAPLSSAEELLQGIEGSILRMVPGGHLMNIESPDEFVAHIEDFFSAASGRSDLK